MYLHLRIILKMLVLHSLVVSYYGESLQRKNNYLHKACSCFSVQTVLWLWTGPHIALETEYSFHIESPLAFANSNNMSTQSLFVKNTFTDSNVELSTVRCS